VQCLIEDTTSLLLDRGVGLVPDQDDRRGLTGSYQNFSGKLYAKSISPGKILHAKAIPLSPLGGSLETCQVRRRDLLENRSFRDHRCAMHSQI
jgi:hypothetical protein